ncbi:MAG TPA: lmo0937 family membrane protein [Gemmatimonadales bacterium]|nr:lmo0937 family membrane protein [Gemmatimonadales bacterium]
MGRGIRRAAVTAGPAAPSVEMRDGRLVLRGPGVRAELRGARLERSPGRLVLHLGRPDRGNESGHLPRVGRSPGSEGASHDSSEAPHDLGETRTKEFTMLWTIFVILVVLWVLGMVSSYTLGGFIHVLLVLAVVVVLIRVIQGRRPL